MEGTKAQKTDVKGEEGEGLEVLNKRPIQTVGGETMIDSSHKVSSPTVSECVCVPCWYLHQPFELELLCYP